MAMVIRLRHIRNILLAALLVGLITAGVTCLLRPASSRPADSASPEYSTVESRVDWMRSRIHGRVPSKILDAQFHQFHNDIPGGHMGPGYTMRFLRARITIAPADAADWAARTRPMPAPPYISTAIDPRYEMTADERPRAKYYDPEPLFGSVDGGHMAITADGTTVFVSIRY